MAELQQPKSLGIRIWRQLSPRKKRAFFQVLALMVLAGVFEVFSLGAVIPFLALLADPDRMLEYPVAARFLARVGLTDTGEMLLAATLLFGILALASGGLRLLLNWYSNRYAYLVGNELGVAYFDRILRRPYAYHALHNSSETVAAIKKVQTVAHQMLLPAMLSISSVIGAVFIVGALLAVDARTTMIAFAGFALIYLVASRLTRPRLRRNSKALSALHARRIQSIQEGLGGIRDLIIDRAQEEFVRRFRALDADFQNAEASTSFISGAPRMVIEAVGMVLIAFIAYFALVRSGDLAEVLPVLGVLALGAQRLLPLMQTLYKGWATISGNYDLAVDILRVLEAPDPVAPAGSQPIPGFRREIRFRNVSFQYLAGTRPAVRGLDFSIPKGAKVGLIGRSGSGKSTTMDLLMGLLEPTAGAIEIDGRVLDRSNCGEWQREIAHVPQHLFLADASIRENIAFGADPAGIDDARVRAAAEAADIAGFIEGLPDGYDTLVGERGTRLSGGQRQRLGIARALYKRASVIFFDEATSALDSETEAAVMAAIERLDRGLTVILVAHRTSTLAFCDQIIRMEDGRIADAGSFTTVVRKAG
ncbi:MAG TPA: ABC transporter ATP-binding protein [Allosphingosinicella sp.]|jgi:ABC-type multidrug transport system fused ATPase/permease subunit